MMAAWARRHAGLLALIAVLGGIYLPWTWSDQLASMGGDSAVYVLSARDYSPFLPPDAVARAVAAETQFPPLYPMLLALTGAAADLHFAHAVTTLCLLGAFAALYAFATGLGLPRSLALAGVGLFAVMPGTYLHAFYLHSENLYLALSLACLAILGRARDTKQGTGWYWAAALTCAAALLARTAGVALLPALGLVLLRKRPRGWIAMLAVAVLPSVAWAVAHRPEHSYSDGLRQHYLDASLTDILLRLKHDALAIAWGGVENVTVTGAFLWPVVVLGLGALAVAAWRFARGHEDAWYVLAYIGMVIVWPYPSESARFAWVIVPVLLVYLLWAGDRAGAGMGSQSATVTRLVRGLLPLALALVLLPGFALAVERARHPAVAERPELRHLPQWYGVDPAASRASAELQLEFAQALRELGAAVPEGGCVFSIKPPLVAFYAHRDSFVPPYERLDDAAFEAWMQSRGCRHFLLLAAASPTFPTPLYPFERLRDRLEIVGVVTSQRDEQGRLVAALARLGD